ncbi:6-carboxyhexanoate--CoA ligase [Bacillus licheniformis]|nr:6-carboxyhexanoate--CoA ligase [Bacillus licheniformis]
MFDIHSGRRIDGRKKRSARLAARLAGSRFQRWAALCGVPPNPRLKEALAIASKVCEHPAVIAELCWSDDPDYITGYVAAKSWVISG